MNRLQKFPTCTILYVGLFFGFLLFSNKVHARNNFNFNTQPNFSYSTGLKVYSADFNGDGKDDILYYNSANGTLDVQTNAITNFNNLNTISQNIPSPSSWLNPTQNWLGANTYLNQTGVQVQFGDVTGDGKLDAVIYVPGINDNIYVAENNGGTGFILSSTPWSTFTHGNFDLLLGNLDASVTKDLILYNKTNGNIQVGLVNGSTFITPTTWATTTNASNWKFYVGNFTSNTEDDLVGYDYINGDLNIFQKTGGNSFTSSLWYHSQGLSLALTDPEVFVQPDIINCPLVVGDFNGDGQTDVMIYKIANVINRDLSQDALSNFTLSTTTSLGQLWMGNNMGNTFKFNLWQEKIELDNNSSNNYSFIASDIYKDNREDIVILNNTTSTIKLGINAPKLEGYCWPYSVKNNATESIKFYISGNGVKEINFFKFESTGAALIGNNNDQVTSITPFGSAINVNVPDLDYKTQYISETAWRDGCNWNHAIEIKIPSTWKSGYYAAELNSIDGRKDYITFIVKATNPSCSKIVVLANTNTWQTYNGWCGSEDDGVYGCSDWNYPNGYRRAKYSPHYPAFEPIPSNPILDPCSTTPLDPQNGQTCRINFSLFSLLRPNPTSRPIIIDGTSNLISSNLAKLQLMNTRAELWTYTWLEQNGYEPNLITDIDLDNNTINEYKTFIASTHPEYWTGNMYNHLKDFKKNGIGVNGGNIIWLGGNSMFEQIEIIGFGTNPQLRFYNGIDNSLRNNYLFGTGAYPKTSDLIGVTTKDNAGPTTSYYSSILQPTHFLFNGIAWSPTVLLGDEGLNTAITTGGAVGWEVDDFDETNLDNITLGAEVLAGDASSTNFNNGDIVYIPSGPAVGTLNNHGFTFSSPSIYFGGSLVVDEEIQTLMKNVLRIDLSPFISNITANTIPCGASVGSITITPGSTNNYTFTLLPGGSTLSTSSTNPISFTGLSAGQYTVQASDVASGCTISAIVFLKATTLSTTKTNITCNSLTNGSIQANMNNAYGTINYILNPGSITNTTGIYSNLGPGTYTVTAIDANSCSLSSTVTFTNPPVLSWGNPIIWGKDCNTATYNITVGANGGVSPYSYAINSTSSWNTVGIGDFIGALLGTNTFYCKDAYGCIISTSITTQNSSNLNWASVIANNINCNGGSGSINANVSGGIGSVNYKLLFYGVSNTSGLFTSLNAGTYFVEATDANGCIVTSVTITEPLPLVASATESRICGSTATINTSGGTSPINTYAISGPTGSTPSINSTGNATNITIVGIYTVTVIDALGCSTSTTLEKVNSDFCCQSLGVTLVQTPDVILLDNKNASDLISINGNNNIVDGKTIYINGDFTVADDITFQNNCLIYFTPNAQIIVNAGKTIHIDNNSILQSACNTMWKGIVANDQSSKIRISDLSQLMNMESGVQCINGAQIDCQNSIFTDNYVSIQLANAPAGYNNVNGNCIIRNNTFTSSGSALLAPYAVQSKSEIGIIVSKCEEVEIGYLGIDPNEKNIFDGLFNGIFIIPSPMYVANDLKFYNNDFININDNVPTGAYHIGTIVNNTYTTHRGAGIFAQEFNNIPMGWSLTNLHKVTLSSIPSGAKFDGCDKAIALNYFGADIKGINTKNTLLGIMCNHTDRQEYVIGNAVSVNSNDPNSNSLNDVIIGMQFIGNSGKSDVNDNKITLNKNYYTIGNLGLLYYWAQGIVVKNYYSPPSLFEIIDNIITIPSIGGIGINLGNTGSGMFVNHNEMYFTTTDVTPSSIAIPADITGIKVSNAKGSELSENFIQGFITSGNTLNTLVFNARPAYGMDINKSSAMKISCNDIRNVSFGMQIVSDCNIVNDENFSGNRFHNHNFPLIFRHLGPEGTFGNIGNPGFDCSNDFVYTPPLGTPGSVFNINNWKVTRISAVGGAALNEKIYTKPGFLATGESGGNYLPTYYTPFDNTGANTPTQCITNNSYAANGSEVGMDIDYAMMVAGDSIIYPEYADVSRWFDERRLFELLDKDSILRNNYYYFQDFYNAQLLLPTDEITQVDRLINDIMASNITDSTDFTNRIAAIANLNNTILSGRGFENNERIINTYFIKWLTGGLSSLTETEKEEIETMAMSCPYVNGTAVYKARTIYASINPGIDYNDLTICNAAGVYKNGGGKGLFDDENTLLNNMISGNGNTTINHVNKFTNKAGVKLYPNPASNNITIDYKLNANETAVLIIYDVIGRERLKFDLQSNVNKVVVKINSLEPGVYSYKYSVNNIQNSTGKLIIE